MILLHRKVNNLKQSELANILGVATSSISAWENNINAPDIEILVQICDVFNVELSEMYGLNTKKDKFNSVHVGSELLSNYKKLNEIGKKKIIEQLKDLTEIKKYTKKS